ncbi:hypothetical protein OG596_20700 [Streptomyces sp. NBC_01102]|uniref:hypothetical protein n=1 Tax=Streptomyces sp. NBC_01102 TaxID=2903749 RepID=UPI003870E74C|nr:hypothetical protein OG596_20700 [Streptomyces sp. NBC_01102]
MSDHGIGWMSGVLGEDYAVTFVRGVTHQELAWMIGGDPDTVMDADTFGRLDAAAPFGTLPASAMLGETGPAGRSPSNRRVPRTSGTGTRLCAACGPAARPSRPRTR